jgi:hypothetical protein
MVAGLKLKYQLVCKDNRCSVIGKHHRMMCTFHEMQEMLKMLKEKLELVLAGKAEKCMPKDLKEE